MHWRRDLNGIQMLTISGIRSNEKDFVERKILMQLFNRNQKDFSSGVHKWIWGNGLLLVPPEISLENINAENKKIYLDLYNYKSDMFADMYQNPEQYLTDVPGILAALDGKPWHQAHLIARWNKYKAKLNKLEEIEQVNLPHIICRQLLDYMKNDSDGYFMDRADYDKFFVKQTLSKCNYKITENELLNILQRCGIAFNQKNKNVYITNSKYPFMFAAILEWQKLLEPYRKVANKKYRYDSAFTHLDYRFFSPDFSLTFENSKWYMNDETIVYLSEINEIINRDKKAFSKLDNTTRIAIGFRMKGGGFFEFDPSISYSKYYSFASPAVLAKMFTNNTPAHTAFEERINGLPNADEVRTAFLKWVRRCGKCPCSPVEKSSMCGNERTVFGRKMKLCGPHIYLRTTDLDAKSLAIMKTILGWD